MSNIENFLPKHSLKTPVLFLVFNRIDTTKLVFESIKKAKPPRLYIASDGPRETKYGEKEKVDEVRDYILDNINWDCEVKILFRDRNLGCKQAVSEAITWFFDNEEQGIILEDDCLPSQSFFWYCEELLEKYKTDMRIWHIGGYLPKSVPVDRYNYNFSRFTHVWGWATWRNRWQYYDVNIELFKKQKNLINDYEFFSEDYVSRSRENILKRLVNNEIDTWDYQWNFCVRVNNGLSIRPSVNLVKNIGFGENATHTTSQKSGISENINKEISFPLKHPDFIMVFKKADLVFSKEFNKNIFYRFKRKFFEQ